MDNVERLTHYQVNGLECIDVIETLGLPYHLGNVLKYLWRAGRKDAAKEIEDLSKARWYLDRHIQRLTVVEKAVAAVTTRAETLRYFLDDVLGEQMNESPVVAILRRADLLTLKPIPGSVDAEGEQNYVLRAYYPVGSFFASQAGDDRTVDKVLGALQTSFGRNSSFEIHPLLEDVQ